MTVSCAIAKGDLPLNISWTLNDRKVNTLDGISTSRLNKKVSHLTIESAQAHHIGKYVCLAENKAGVDRHSSYLNINGSLFYNLIIYLAKTSLVLSHHIQIER